MMTREDWADAAGADELAPESVKSVEIRGRRLVLAKCNGKIYALDGVCPHQGGPLAEGGLWRGALECPWHHYRYDLETGRNLYPADVYPSDMPQLAGDLKPARTYPVRVERGRILVSLGSKKNSRG